MSKLTKIVKENVWDYPRPPALEQTARRLRVIFQQEGQEDVVLADTTKGYRVLETSHPPTYYIPPSDVKTELLTKNSKQSFCEWKGVAAYFDFKSPSGATVKSRVWSYPKPSEKFIPIKDYLCFYASPFTCFVDDEQADPQAGSFYGSWLTSEITGGSKGIKGGPGTLGW